MGRLPRVALADSLTLGYYLSPRWGFGSAFVGLGATKAERENYFVGRLWRCCRTVLQPGGVGEREGRLFRGEGQAEIHHGPVAVGRHRQRRDK